MFEVKGIVKRYTLDKEVLWAVDGVDLSLKGGETVALVGESGCGKSTVARMLVKLEEPDEGNIIFEGDYTSTLAGKELTAFRRRVQMIFQDPYNSLNPRMKVGNIIGEPLEIHGIAKGREKAERVEELLNRVGLDSEAADKYPREFSGGQRQRICIARALAVEPSFIIADEPLSALDVSVQAQIIELLIELKEERGLGYLLISHDLRVVEYLADRVAVMYLGEIVEESTTKSLFAEPLHPYTQTLIESALGERKEHIEAKGEVPSPLMRPEGCFFHPRCPKAFDTCYHIRPNLKLLPGGQKVRCHLFDQE